MNNDELIIILDFGGQYNQLIARRVRECNVYSEVLSYTTPLDIIKNKKPKGIIFTGGPSSVYENNAPTCDKGIFKLGVPILGICYGSQLMSLLLGGSVKKGIKREYGETLINIESSSLLFKEIPKKNICLMSHTDLIENIPEEFKVTAKSNNCPIVAMENKDKNFYGIQFHPEVNNTQNR